MMLGKTSCRHCRETALPSVRIGCGVEGQRIPLNVTEVEVSRRERRPQPPALSSRPRPDSGVVSERCKHQSDAVYASAITRYELRFGACLHREPDALWARLQAEVLPAVTWLPVSQAIAEHGAPIAAELYPKGYPCGELDPLLAATAIEHEVTLVTRNTRHFEVVSGLVLENWFTSD